MKRQSGFTTFTVTLLLILILIGISLLVGKLMVADRKVSVNEVQYRQALALAEVGIADGMGRLAADTTWRTGNSGATTTLSTGSYTLTALDTTPITVGTISLTPVELSASAALAGGMGGAATVRVQVAGYNLMTDVRTVPLMVAGSNTIGGNFTVVANPNGGGPGVPLSVWSDTPVGGSGSWQSCNQQEYNNGCSGELLSTKSKMGSDIKDNDPTFPQDLLKFLFNEPNTPEGWANLMAKAVAAPPNSTCSSLDGNSTGIFIIQGDCSLPKSVVGSAGAPVILIVRDGNLTLNAKMVVNGIIYVHSSNPATFNPRVQANGGATINGSLISNFPLKNANGTFDVKYDQTVIDSIQSSAKFRASKIVPGSWRDW